MELLFSLRRKRSIQILVFVAFLHMLLVSFEVPFVFKNGFGSVSQEGILNSNNEFLNYMPFVLESEENLEVKEAPIRPHDVPSEVSNHSKHERKIQEFVRIPLSSLNFSAGIVNSIQENGILESVKEALEIGGKVWHDLELEKIGDKKIWKNNSGSVTSGVNKREREECPQSLAIRGGVFETKGKVMVLPCGLTLGSHITVVGKPRVAHTETDPKISLLKNGLYLMVSQFMMELKGLRIVDGEDPPRILHFNPRVKGDWSGKPVIEQNSCYRMQWGTAQRCDGRKSRADEETGE